MEVALVTENIGSGAATKAKEEAFLFEVEYVSKVGSRRDEVGELSKQLRRQDFSAAAESKDIVVMHVELNSRKAKADYLNVALKMSRKEVADNKVVFEELKARLNAGGDRLVVLRCHSDDKSASAATCCKELLQGQKNFAAALE